MMDDTTGEWEAHWFTCANDCGIALRVMAGPFLPYAAAKVRAKACGWTEHTGDDGDHVWLCPACAADAGASETPEQEQSDYNNPFWFECRECSDISLRVMANCYEVAMICAEACGWDYSMNDDGFPSWICPACRRWRQHAQQTGTATDLGVHETPEHEQSDYGNQFFFECDGDCDVALRVTTNCYEVAMICAEARGWVYSINDDGSHSWTCPTCHRWYGKHEEQTGTAADAGASETPEQEQSDYNNPFWFEGHTFACVDCRVALHIPVESLDSAKIKADTLGWRRSRDKDMAIVWRCPSCARPSRDGIPHYYLIPDGATCLWDIIKELGLTHCHASALEYVYRAGRKPGAPKAEDLRKAVANLEYEIALLDKEEET